MTISQACLDKLAKFDTPTICNVIELFDVRPRNRGYMDARIRSNFPDFAPVVGFAATAQFRSDSPAEGGDAYGSIQAQLEQFQQLPGPAMVVFQDVDDAPAAAASTFTLRKFTAKVSDSSGPVMNSTGPMPFVAAPATRMSV